MEFLLSLSGVLLGGLISLTAIWVKQLLDQRRELKKWFEDEYITGAIEPIINTLILMILSFNSKGNILIQDIVPPAKKTNKKLKIKYFMKLLFILESPKDISEILVSYYHLQSLYADSFSKHINVDMRNVYEVYYKRISSIYEELREGLLQINPKSKAKLYKETKNKKITKLLYELSSANEKFQKELVNAKNNPFGKVIKIQTENIKKKGCPIDSVDR